MYKKMIEQVKKIITDLNNLDVDKLMFLLNKAKDRILESYVIKTGKGKETLSKLMDDETWLNTEQALEYGFIDEIIDEESEKEQRGQF